ncbi:MAG: flavodoxin [Eubacterium sp.]|nr:flavodoxin [Eubacterium sp.]
MRTLIVYYSLEGNTDYAAKRIAAELGADTLRIRPVKAYPDKGVRKFLWGGKSAVMAEKPELKPYRLGAVRYDVVVFGFPVWAGNIAPPLRTFIHNGGPEAARYAAFACQSGSGAEKAFGKLEACLGRRLSQTLVLIDPKDRPDPAKDARIEAFCGSLMGEPG